MINNRMNTEPEKNHDLNSLTSLEVRKVEALENIETILYRIWFFILFIGVSASGLFIKTYLISWFNG